MTGKNHLGNDKELSLFISQMKKQLKKHEKEKQSMRTWSFESVMLNNIPEILDRIASISDLNVIIKNDLFNKKTKESKKEINKQFVHIANYCLMGFLKSKEKQN